MPTDRERRQIRYETAVQSLDFALDKLSQLSEQMDKMVAYWIRMNGVLEYIFDRAKRLQNDILLQERIKSLKEEWDQVHIDCLQYKEEVFFVVSLLTKPHCHLPVSKVAGLQPHVQSHDGR
jgi:hypothetical protein